MFELQTLKIRTDNAERGWREKVGHFLSHSFRWVELVGCLFCLMLGALSRTASVASNVRSRLFLLIIAGCLFARCSFYAMADACAWTDGSRYPRALSLWVTIFLLGVFFWAGQRVGKVREHQSGL
jgi:type IV secretory pathway TrbF-like protein